MHSRRPYGGMLSSSFSDLLFAAFILVSEAVLHLVWMILPLTWLEGFNLFPAGSEEDPNLEKDFVELTESLFGPDFAVEEHHCVTKDGYILGLHRVKHIPKDKSGLVEETNGVCPPKQGVVFIMHGVMQSSEAWVATGKRSLPYVLASAGYDVWLGNNRGNKYSHKHLKYSPNHNAFWDFCIDHLGLDDIPSMINYILTQTGAETLSYIGFSNGSAQGFAALSSDATLTKKVNIFIALAPATRVLGVPNRIVRSLTVTRPGLVFMLFGKRALLPETLFWRKVLPTPIYIFVVDWCMKFIFGWKLHNLDPQEKPLLYSHIYSFSSVKTLVQWFQITRTKRFQMFDGNLNADNFEKSYRTYLIPSYNISSIRCPVGIFYGGMDTLPDVEWLVSQFKSSKNVFIHKSDTYEHLDFMWASDVHKAVFPRVLALLKEYS